MYVELPFHMDTERLLESAAILKRKYVYVHNKFSSNYTWVDSPEIMALNHKFLQIINQIPFKN